MENQTRYATIFDIRDTQRLQKALLILFEFVETHKSSLYVTDNLLVNPNNLVQQIAQVIDPEVDRFLLTEVKLPYKRYDLGDLISIEFGRTYF